MLKEQLQTARANVSLSVAVLWAVAILVAVAVFTLLLLDGSPGSVPVAGAQATTLPATTLPATTLPATTLPATTLPATTLPATTLPAGTCGDVTGALSDPLTITCEGLPSGGEDGNVVYLQIGGICYVLTGGGPNYVSGTWSLESGGAPCSTYGLAPTDGYFEVLDNTTSAVLQGLTPFPEPTCGGDCGQVLAGIDVQFFYWAICFVVMAAGCVVGRMISAS